MAEERELALRLLNLGDLRWFFPEEAVRKLELLAETCRIDLATDPAKPPPARHLLDIVGRLVREMILGGPPEALDERSAQLDPADRQYLTHLIRSALQTYRRRQAEAPHIPLGFLPEERAVWATMLSGGGEPMPPWATIRRH